MIGEGIYPRDPTGKLDCKDTPPDRIHEVLAAEEEALRLADTQTTDVAKEILEEEDQSSLIH